MEILGCADNFQESLLGLLLIIISEVFLCFAVLWNEIAVFLCVMLDIFIFIIYLVDWFYFSRKIIINETGCTFSSKMRSKKYTWQEINIKYIDNTRFLFGDSEIPCKGIILSAKPISKPAYIGAMTYCRFTHPRISVFVQFGTPSDILKSKRTSAKFIYGGFCANRSELMDFLKSVGVSVYH